MKECGGVFEGGGVRGIGHVGAVCAMEAAGYEFINLAGSSAGAVVAALLAAGYPCQELKKEMENLDYLKFRGRGLTDYLGTVGKALAIFLEFGIYNTDYVEFWMDQMLGKKNIYSFRDLKKTGRSLKITASDLTDRKLLVLPDDLRDFGTDPDSFSIGAAVRMSVSIPVYFEPVRLRDKYGKEHLIADGGLLSNFPMWILDDGKEIPDQPVFGFKFLNKGGKCQVKQTEEPINIAGYMKSIIATCMDAIDNGHLLTGDYERTIGISPIIKGKNGGKKINAADFDITKEEGRLLFENGKQAAEEFLKTWDFEQWKRKYRMNGKEEDRKSILTID